MENKFMLRAIELSKIALEKGEIPVGAVVVQNGNIIGEGYNTREADKNPLGHAEVTAISNASKAVGDWRLNNADIYVTLEPCPMCTGAIINSRIKRVFFGAYDNSFGSLGSRIDLSAVGYPEKIEVHGGIMQNECGEILKSFFKSRRKNLP